MAMAMVSALGTLLGSVLALARAGVLPGYQVPPNTIWFASWQHAGHIKAICPTARELQRRGWEVAIVVHEEARQYVPTDLKVISAGNLPWTWEEELEFRDLLWTGPSAPNGSESGEAALTPEQAKALSEKRATASENYFLGSQRSLANGILHYVRGVLPDEGIEGLNPFIVADISSPGALDAAQTLDLPFAVFSSWPVGPTLHSIGDKLAFQQSWLPSELFILTQSMGANSFQERAARAFVNLGVPLALEFAGFHKPRRDLRSSFKLPVTPALELMEPPRLKTGDHPLVLVSTHWGLDRARPLPPYLSLVGPTENYGEALELKPPMKPALKAWMEKQDVVVYVSLGTNVRPTSGLVETFLVAMRALDEVSFLWDVREGMEELLENLPPNVRAEEWAPQLQILSSPKTKVFVSHCGLNSLHEALHFGVPVVGLPFIADQLVSARIVEEVGVGVRLAPQKLTSNVLENAVRTVLTGEGFRSAAQRVGSLAGQAGGAALAANILEVAIQEGVSHLQMPGKDTIAGRVWDVYLVGFAIFCAFLGALKVACCPRRVLRGDEDKASKED